MVCVDFLHGGNIHEIRRRYKREVIDFSANINPLGLPDKVTKTILKNFDKILHYPDPDGTTLIMKIARYWGISPKNVLLGNGSAELIYLIVSVFKPKTAYITAPSFSEYERALRNIGAKTRFLNLREKDGFELTRNDIAGKTDISFLCNPNNPTGNFIVKSMDNNRIERLARKLVVIDEAFMDFVPSQENYTLIRKAVKSRKIAVLRTFTKMFALPGLRIGYLIGHKDLINKLRRFQTPWNVNCLAQTAAETILEDKRYVKRTVYLVKKEKEFLLREISAMKKLIPYPSQANYILVRIKDRRLAASLLRKRLISKGILIRDGANFRGLGSEFFRVAVRLRKENLRLIRALKEVL